MIRKMIWITLVHKDQMYELKIHPRETYDDILDRLLSCYGKVNKIKGELNGDEESPDASHSDYNDKGGKF